MITPNIVSVQEKIIKPLNRERCFLETLLRKKKDCLRSLFTFAVNLKRTNP